MISTKNKNKKAISMLLVLALMVATIGSVLTYSNLPVASAETKSDEKVDSTKTTKSKAGSKDEVIYANLDPNGNLEEMFVVNVLDIGSSGKATDYGDYSKVVNLTDTTDINNEDGKISVDTSPGKFYYEGYGSDSVLPWTVSIDYYLDNEKINPNELAGNNGKLKIQIKTIANESADSVFYDNYMLQISVPIDLDKSDNISAPGATEGLSGGTKLLNYMVLPGDDADYTLTLDINDFEMDSIQISGIPFSMDFDIGELTSQFDQLINAVSDLEEGMRSLDFGVQSASNGLKEISIGSNKLNDGLSKTKSSGLLLAGSSNKINGGITTMANMFNSAIDPTEIDKLVDGLNDMADSLSLISLGLDSMLTQIQAVYDSLPDYPSEYIGDLDPSSSTDAAILEYIEGANSFIQTYGYLSSSMGAMATNIGNISSGLNSVVDELDDLKQLAALGQGLSALAGEYNTFNYYLQTYFMGVNKIASEYGQMNSGISKSSNGLSLMAAGSSQLSYGMGQLNNSVGSIPENIQEQIDGLLGDGDYEATSFVSKKNKNISSVQFVITTSKIEKPKVVKEETEEKGKESLLQKIINLFR